MFLFQVRVVFRHFQICMACDLPDRSIIHTRFHTMSNKCMPQHMWTEIDQMWFPIFFYCQLFLFPVYHIDDTARFLIGDPGR